MSAAKKALAVVAIGVGVGLGVAGLSDPPGVEECELVTVLRATDAGLALESVDVCGSQDGGTATGEEFIREVSRGPKRARSGKAIGLHRGQPSGCSCSTGTGCERRVVDLTGSESWAAAAKGAVMQAGEWKGAGCAEIASCYDVSEMPLGSNLAEGCR